jgi:hypothetical protein
VTVEWSGSDITVTIPNLLKYRDEWSRKSKVTPESLRSKEQIHSTDTETNAETDPKPHAADAAFVVTAPTRIRKGKRTLDEGTLSRTHPTRPTDPQEPYESFADVSRGRLESYRAQVSDSKRDRLSMLEQM